MRFKVKSCLFLLLPVWAAIAEGSQIDPYYSSMMKAGKEAYAVRDCRKAVQYLEVAVFGVLPHKEIAAEAYIYLGLSKICLSDTSGGSKALSKAVELLSPRGLEALPLEESVRADAEAAMASFAGIATPRPIEAQPVSPPGESDEIPLLESRLKADFRNLGLYYELYDAYRRAGDVPACERIMTSLTQIKPDESQAWILLARAEYLRKDFKSARKHLNRGLGPSMGTGLVPAIRLRARIYVTLCLFKLERAKETGAYLKSLRDEFPVDEILAAVRDEGLESTWGLMAARFPEKN